MLISRIILILALSLCGCASSYIVSTDHHKNTRSYDQLNEDLKNRTVTILLKSGGSFTAESLVVQPDTSFGIDSNSKAKIAISNTLIHKIIFKDYSRGALDGLHFGLLGSAGFVAVYMLAGGGDILPWKIAGAIPLICAGFGVGAGHTIEYFFP